MTTLDRATVDHLLTTTRAVRKRLDLDRPVEPEVIEECLRLAIQAPTGGNSQGWRWIVVTDPDKRAALADAYREVWAPYIAASRAATPERRRAAGARAWTPRATSPTTSTRCRSTSSRASTAASSAAASWSSAAGRVRLDLSRGVELPARAAQPRARLRVHDAAPPVRATEAAELLGIPEGVVQTALIPVAYFTGDDFQPAKRRPVEEITYWNGWKQPRA